MGDPLLPEQIAGLSAWLPAITPALFKAAARADQPTDGLLLLANTLPQLLSAAERGIAAGEEAARRYKLAREWEERALAEIARAEKAEADLAASNARIGELEKEIARRDEADRVQRLRGPAEYGW